MFRSDYDAILYEQMRHFWGSHPWEGVKQLLTAETHCEVVGNFDGRGRDTIAGNYLKNYERLWPWKMTQESLDGEAVMVCWQEVNGRWQPHGVARIEWANGAVKHIRDYIHVEYLLREFEVEGRRLTGDE